MIQGFCQFGPLSVSKELGVEGDHLHREGNLVCDHLSGAVARGPQTQILGPIVGSLAVDMMDSLLREERSSDLLFHDVTVFEHFDGGRAWEPDSHIAVPAEVARGLPVGILGGVLKAFVKSFALLAAKLAPAIRFRLWGGVQGYRGSALLTGPPILVTAADAAATRGAEKRVSSMFGPVGPEHARVLLENHTAYLASEVNRDDLAPSSLLAPVDVARVTTVFAICVTFLRGLKGRAASFARALNEDNGSRHDSLPLRFVRKYHYTSRLVNARTFNVGVA